jgi:hypothetical protein
LGHPMGTMMGGGKKHSDQDNVEPKYLECLGFYSTLPSRKRRRPASIKRRLPVSGAGMLTY